MCDWGGGPNEVANVGWKPEPMQKDTKPQGQPPKPKNTKTIKGVATPDIKK